MFSVSHQTCTGLDGLEKGFKTNIIRAKNKNKKSKNNKKELVIAILC
jgi:hypothetical protein